MTKSPFILLSALLLGACSRTAAKSPETRVSLEQVERMLSETQLDPGHLAYECTHRDRRQECMLVAVAYDRGIRVPADPVRAVDFAERACFRASDNVLLAVCLEFSRRHDIRPPLGYATNVELDDVSRRARFEGRDEGRESATLWDVLGL